MRTGIVLLSFFFSFDANASELFVVQPDFHKEMEKAFVEKYCVEKAPMPEVGKIKIAYVRQSDGSCKIVFVEELSSK